MTPTDLTDCSFLEGGGSAGALMRAHDWSTSPLGTPLLWPQALRTIVGLVLNSKFPMFVAWGPELAFLYNDAYAEILGDKHPAALGRPFQEIWSEIWTDVEPIARRALMGQSEYHANMPLTMHRKGYAEETWFTFSYSPARGDSGQIAGVYCACTETTEQVLSKRVREAEYERLREMFQDAPGLIAIVREPAHVFEFANEAYIRLVGQRDLIGKSVALALPEVAAQGFIDLLDSVYRSGEPYIGSGVPVKLTRSPDAPMEERFVSFIFQPIRDDRGRVSGIFIEGSDVTDHVTANTALRDAQRELELANRRKDEFLAMLAHELRNPLAPIAAAAELLRRGKFDESRVRQTSAVIARQVAHMTAIVDDLLDVSRLTRGLVTMGDEVVELINVVEESVEQVQPLIRQKELFFSTQVAPGPIFVRGDRTRLVQVFSNILQNATKYTPERGHITLRLCRTGEQIEFGVVDDGAGIPAELLPEIFDLFTQAERTPDRAQGGLGLGWLLLKASSHFTREVFMQEARASEEAANLSCCCQWSKSLNSRSQREIRGMWWALTSH
jgi:nitrogen-specific signal transduction histidine kinase